MGKEASSGLYCEYTYQFSRMAPVKITSNSVSETFSTAVFQTTGLASDYAFTNVEKQKINTNNNFFIL
jgi:hypothetical protein